MKSKSTRLEEAVVPVVEETIRLEKRQVSTGKVRLTSTFEEIEEIARASLAAESVEIERVPINEPVDERPLVRTEGDVTIVPVVEEILVVEKRLVLVEEIRLRRRVETEAVEVPVVLRKQRVTVERVPPAIGDEESTP